jgi:hypothetical protein
MCDLSSSPQTGKIHFSMLPEENEIQEDQLRQIRLTGDRCMTKSTYLLICIYSNKYPLGPGIFVSTLQETSFLISKFL